MDHSRPVSANNPDACFVGVDFGTLSGRALVVRARDGAELGTAVHEYRHGVMDAVLAATGEPLPPDWALQDPEDYRDVLRQAVPAAVAAAGIDPARVVGIGTDFTACTVLPAAADGTPLCQLPAARRPPARLPEAVEAPRGPAAGGPDQRAGARARRAVDRPLRREDLVRVGVRQGAAAARGGSGDLPAASRWIEAADWIIWQLAGVETRNACTAGYKGIRQDGRYPTREFLAGLDPAVRRLRRRQAGAPGLPLGARAGSLTAQAAAWTGPAGGDRGRRRQRRRARDRARGRGDRARADGRDHGHVDLPRDERHPAGRGPRHVRRGRRRHRGRAVGLRGGAERRRATIFAWVRRARGRPRPTARRRRGAASACTTCWRRRPPRSRSARTA